MAGELAAEQGPEPSSWTGTAARTGFTPGLIPDTIRATNRPTFQQVLELAGKRRGAADAGPQRPPQRRGGAT